MAGRFPKASEESHGGLTCIGRALKRDYWGLRVAHPSSGSEEPQSQGPTAPLDSLSTGLCLNRRMLLANRCSG